MAVTGLAVLTGDVDAQVVRDGSVGTRGPLPLVNKTFNIPASDGSLRGANLFHSFSQFDLASGEIASFTGPSSVKNVFARVTGPQPTTIDGTIRNSIPRATFFLINPNGVVFGPDAKLDLKGSFAVTTADEIKLSGSGRFAASRAAASTLSSAPPSAFGFLKTAPAPITINGPASSAAPLLVGARQSISIVGGQIHMDSATLQAAAGRMNLISAGSSGVVSFDPADTSAKLRLTGFSRMADVDVAATLLILDGQSGGNLAVRAKNLSMTDSIVTAQTRGSVAGKDVDIAVSDTISLVRSTIDATTSGSATGGSLRLSAAAIEIADGSILQAPTVGSGVAGDILLRAGVISIVGTSSAPATPQSTGESQINAGTGGPASGGNIDIRANHLLVDNSLVFASASNFATGPSGNVRVTSNTVDIQNGALLSNSTFGRGAGGDIDVTAAQLTLDGRGATVSTGIIVTTEAADGGAGGNIHIDGGTLTIRRDAQLSASSRGSGPGGSITIGNKAVILDATDATSFTGIAASAASSGRGGDLSIQSHVVQVLNGATISTAASGTGVAGSLDLNARQVVVDGGPVKFASGINAETDGPAAGGMVRIQADQLTLRRNGLISASTFAAGRGGDIRIDAAHLLLSDAAILVRSASSGDAGNIDLTAGTVQLTNRALITSSASGQGSAGSVTAAIGTLSLRSSAAILVTAAIADGGDVAIDANGPVRIDNATIGAQANHNGGSVRLTSPAAIELRGGHILAQAGTDGAGGSIFLGNGRLLMLDGQPATPGADPSSLVAKAVQGQGGRILILSNDFQQTAGSVIDFSSQFGAQGSESIIATDIVAGLARLNGELQGGGVTLQPTCAIRLGIDVSSFIIAGRTGTPVEPGGFIPSLDLWPRRDPSGNDQRP